MCQIGLTAAGLPTVRAWKAAHIVGAGFTNLRLFSHKFPFIMNTTFVPLLVTLYAGTVKLFAEASEPFIHALSALRLLENFVLGVHPSGNRAVEVGGC